MPVPTITTNTAALQNGWNFSGRDGNWWAEKRVQDGGKVLAVNSTSAGLIAAIQDVEVFHGRQKDSPMFDKSAGLWKGHI